MPKLENRFLETEDVTEIRSGEGEEEQRFVSGVGIVYDKEVEIWPGFREKIRQGAFTDALSAGSEIKSYFNHRADYVLSTTKSTPALELEDTSKGLRFKSPIPPTSYGKDLMINLERKNVRGASFAFTVDEEGDTVTRDEKGVYHREIVKANLFEIGPVTNPAYPSTKVGLRSEEDLRAEMETRCKKEDVPANNNNLRSMRLKLTERGL